MLGSSVEAASTVGLITRRCGCLSRYGMNPAEGLAEADRLVQRALELRALFGNGEARVLPNPAPGTAVQTMGPETVSQSAQVSSHGDDSDLVSVNMKFALENLHTLRGGEPATNYVNISKCMKTY